MKDTFLDVRLELDAMALAQEADPARFVIDLARSEADKLCDVNGAKLRTDRPPEIIVTRGENRLTGQLCVLVATRWACVAPENVPMGPPR